MTSCPSSARSAAATDESTPPDIATTMRMCSILDQPRRLEDTKTSLYKNASCFRGFVASHDLAGETAQLLDQARQDPRDEVNLGLGGESAEAESQRVLRSMRRQPHRLQHVRRFERPRRAGRASRHRDAFQVERDQQALSLDAIEADVGRVRNASFAIAVHRGAGYC